MSLPIQWQMIGVLRDEDVRDGGVGRQPTLDQPRRSGRLDDVSSDTQVYEIRRQPDLRVVRRSGDPGRADHESLRARIGAEGMIRRGTA
jgi:hypothetical protein